MENFKNEVIDITILPKFESVKLNTLHSNYWKVILFNFVIFFLFLIVGIFLGFHYITDLIKVKNFILITLVLIIAILFIIFRLSFLKKGYAFRQQDVIFRNGIIATNTTIIPYNRIQHVALHEGLISRYFGLTSIEIFTASESDIVIPGIKLSEAEILKQLLIGKIQKQL